MLLYISSDICVLYPRQELHPTKNKHSLTRIQDKNHKINVKHKNRSQKFFIHMLSI